MNSFEAGLVELKAQLTDHGMRGALLWLQQQTQYRFAALRMMDNGQLKTIHLLDKETHHDLSGNHDADCMHYCNLVMSLGQPVVVTDALHDMRAYCGRPLQRADGSVCGTICYFDSQPREPTDLERDMLKATSAVISAALGQLAAR